MSPRICVLGESMDRAIWLLDKLCEANDEDIYRRRLDVGIMNDGTELIAISISDSTKLWGHIFDYVFYEDGVLLSYCSKYGGAMEYLEKRCLVKSSVPREFQWCAVDTDNV